MLSSTHPPNPIPDTIPATQAFPLVAPPVPPRLNVSQYQYPYQAQAQAHTQDVAQSRDVSPGAGGSTKGKERASDICPDVQALPSSSSSSSSSISDEVGTSQRTDRLAQTTTMDSFIDAQGDRLYYRPYRSEDDDMDNIMQLVEDELSEPYNIYTYRYFLFDWPHLTYLIFSTPSPSARPIALIISKLEAHRTRSKSISRGYIAMLSVSRPFRRRGLASWLVNKTVEVMRALGAGEVMLETEWDNEGSLALYDRLGFMREKRLHRFYSNAKDAYRLILPLDDDEDEDEDEELRRRLEGGLKSIKEVEEDRDNDNDRHGYFI